MTIAKLMQGRSTEVFTCEADARVGDAVTMLAERRIGALPVVDGGAVVGIVSERDILYRLNELGAALLEKHVRDVMTSPALTVDPATSVLEALALMTRRRIRHLPVVEQDGMIGFVSIGDLVKYRIELVQSEAEAMRSYIQNA